MHCLAYGGRGPPRPWELIVIAAFWPRSHEDSRSGHFGTPEGSTPLGHDLGQFGTICKLRFTYT